MFLQDLRHVGVRCVLFIMLCFTLDLRKSLSKKISEAESILYGYNCRSVIHVRFLEH